MTNLIYVNDFITCNRCWTVDYHCSSLLSSLSSAAAQWHHYPHRYHYTIIKLSSSLITLSDLVFQAIWLARYLGVTNTWSKGKQSGQRKLVFREVNIITWTSKDFLLQMLGSSVFEITSFVHTGTITLFDLRDRSRLFTCHLSTSIICVDVLNCHLSACFFSYLFWLDSTFPIIHSSTFVGKLDGAIDINCFRFV